jgi:hypothetical protein
MSELRRNSRTNEAAARGKTAATWNTEFERIFVLGAARIRGEKLSGRRLQGRHEGSDSPTR